MKQTGRIIIGMLLTLLLMAACKSGTEGEEARHGDCYLTFYVYSPANPIITRTDDGHQAATDAENAIHKLQLWVFKHDGGDLVGYLEEDNVSIAADGSTFRILVDPDLADHPVPVDVYAVANITSGNSGNTFNRMTTRSELDAATIDANYFGVKTPTTEVPTEGLPMTGVLKSQPIYGTFPALRVGTESEMATVTLVRTVSKLRFVLCRGDREGVGNESYQLQAITHITLNGIQIPSQEYLMLTEPFNMSLNPANPVGSGRLHIVAGSYEADAIDFGRIETYDIPKATDTNNDGNPDPRQWLQDSGETAEEYIERINAGIANEEDGVKKPLLREFGNTYLRESDKKLMGTISYRVASDADSDPDRVVVFEMNRAGDFGRNHSWTILVLFEGGRIRVVNIVQNGIRNWVTSGTKEHDVYNW